MIIIIIYEISTIKIITITIIIIIYDNYHNV